MSADAKAKEILKHRDALKFDRLGYESNWQEIADLMFPRAADIQTVSQPGVNRRAKMLSGEAEQAGLRFASAIQNLMTGEGQPWFHLATRDRSLMKSRAVRLWLQEAERICYDVFNSPESGFHLAAHEHYLQQGFLGTGPLLVIDRPAQMPMYIALPLPECCLDRNPWNRIDTLIRTYKKSAKELVQAFPSAQKFDKVRQAIEATATTRFTCVHAIRPRKEAILGSRNALAMAFESVYVLQEEQVVLEESGFESFPAVVPRWTVSANEIYGRGPGDTALADTRMLMEVARSSLKMRQKVADPPLSAPDGGYTGPLKLYPGAVNMLKNGHLPATPLHQIDMQGLLAADDLRAQTVDAIRRAFYNDLFQLEGPVTDKGAVQHMSATEAAIRQRDKLGGLGPIFSRQKVEMLGPLIFRMLAILERNRMLPPAPPELEDAEVLAEYVAPLAVAQETGDVGTIIEGINLAGAVASISPGAVDILNGDSALARGLRALRFPEEGMRSQEEIDEMEADGLVGDGGE